MLPTRAVLVFSSILTVAYAQLTATLPNYTGQYGVGTADIEVPVSTPSNITDTTYKSNGEAAFELETVLFTLYYPTNTGVTTAAPKHEWLPGNSTQIAEGIAQNSGVNIDPNLIATGFEIFVGGLTIPAQVDADIVTGNGKFPVLIFSHGDSSLASWYSTLLGEIASRGYVVAAITHRDGTAPATNVTFLEGRGTNRTVLGFTNTQVNPSLSYTDFKFRQDQFRQAEIAATIEVVRSINDGSGNGVYRNSSRGEGSTVQAWRDRLDIDHLLLTGHSFGSNTVIQTITTASSSEVPAVAAITFDPGKDSGPLNTNITIPIAILDSEEWSALPEQFYGKTHFDTVKSIAENSLRATKRAWFATLLGTNHASITDAPLISSSFISFFTNFTSNTTLDPKFAIEQYVKVTDLFLQDLVNGTRSGLLAQNVSSTEFTILSNSTVQNDPWELHVGPSGLSSGSETNGTGGGGLSRVAPGVIASALIAVLSLLAGAAL